MKKRLCIGMGWLRNLTAGLPVVAQDRPGVRDVLAPGTYPTPGDGPAALTGIGGERNDAPLGRSRARTTPLRVGAVV